MSSRSSTSTSDPFFFPVPVQPDNINVSTIPAQKECTCLNPTGRNLVICIDGTLNQANGMPSNVIELYSLLLKDKNQLTYYNSGIGTYVRTESNGPRLWYQWSAQMMDMTIAWNLKARILRAYQWLAENYVDGDRIFLFGFSRGAYQVRVIAGMLHRVGLLHKGNNEQIPFAYELYKKDNGLNSLCDWFKERFSRQSVKAHFVGAWDTVSSVGLFRGTSLPHTADGMKHVCAFRHALALDEWRVKFLPDYANGAAAPDGENVKEVWFSGSHSDIGGNKNNNWGPALHWMIYEAKYFGLRVVPRALVGPVLDSTIPVNINLSMGRFWKMVEYVPFIVPKMSFSVQDNASRLQKYTPHFSKPRLILEKQLIHHSVLTNIRQHVEPKYEPAPFSPFTGGWDPQKLTQEENILLDKNWFEDARSTIFQLTFFLRVRAYTGFDDPSERSEYLDAIRTFLKLASTGIGLFSIKSQLIAIERLVEICQQVCDSDTAIATERQDLEEKFFKVLIDVIMDFKLSPNDGRIQQLIFDLEEVVTESHQKENDMFVKYRCTLIQDGINKLKHRHLVVFIDRQDTRLISRAEELDLCYVTSDRSAAHIVLSINPTTQELWFSSVDTKVARKDVDLPPRYITDDQMNLAHVIGRLSHFYQFLECSSDTLKQSVANISISFFEVEESRNNGSTWFKKKDDAQNLCSTDNTINMTITPGSNKVYGLELTNNNADGEILYPVVLDFESTDFKIWRVYPSIFLEENVDPLPTGGKSLTIGYGDGPGSYVNPFGAVLMEPGYETEVGFYKIFLFKGNTNLDPITRWESAFSVRNGRYIPPSQPGEIFPFIWGSITLTVLYRRGTASGADNTASNSNNTASGSNDTVAGSNNPASGSNDTTVGSNIPASGSNDTDSNSTNTASGSENPFDDPSI